MSEERGRMSSVLGPTGLVLGNVQGQGDFEVRGRVQGDVVLSGRVLVAAGGLVLGTIEAQQITVSGTVRGDLIAEDGVEITGSGQVEGNVTSPRVAIESGAKVRGHLRTGEEPPAALRGGKLALEERSALGPPPGDIDDSKPVEAMQRPPEPQRRFVVQPEGPATEGSAEARAGGGKRRRKRRRGGERGASNETSGPQTDASGTSAAHLDEVRPELRPPARPTRPSGPLPPTELTPAEGAARGRRADPPPPNGEPTPGRPRRSKKLPTFVKGTRGHLRG